MSYVRIASSTRYWMNPRIAIFGFFFLTSCGIESAGNHTDSRNASEQPPVVTSASAATNVDLPGAPFENASSVAVKTEEHPWDAPPSSKGKKKSLRDLSMENLELLSAKSDTTPQACSKHEEPVCSSCCDQLLTLGTMEWEECIAKCPAQPAGLWEREY